MAPRIILDDMTDKSIEESVRDCYVGSTTPGLHREYRSLGTLAAIESDWPIFLPIFFQQRQTRLTITTSQLVVHR